MLDIVSGYERVFQVRFSEEKSDFIEVNGKEGYEELKWRLREVKMECTAKYKYNLCALETGV